MPPRHCSAATGRCCGPAGAVAAVHSTLAARRPVVLAAPVCNSQALDGIRGAALDQAGQAVGREAAGAGAPRRLQALRAAARLQRCWRSSMPLPQFCQPAMPASKPPLVSRLAFDGGIGLPKRTLLRLPTPGLPLKRMYTSCVPLIEASACFERGRGAPARGRRQVDRHRRPDCPGCRGAPRCCPAWCCPWRRSPRSCPSRCGTRTPLNLIQSPSSV